MPRRTLLSLLLAIPAACSELRRYHSSVSFQLSTDEPSAGQAVEVRFQYLDEAPPGSYSVVLLSMDTRAEVDRAEVTDASSRPVLTPPSPGAYSVEFRKDGRMVAHRRLTAR